jgi:hypothetical protein
VKENRLVYYEPVPDISEIELPVAEDSCPDIFIYLCDGNGREVSFVRFPFKTVSALEFKVPPRWMPLKENKGYDLINPPNNPGCLLVSLRAGRSSALPTRPYLVSRPLAGVSPYQVGLFHVLPEIPLEVAPGKCPDYKMEFATRGGDGCSQASRHTRHFAELMQLTKDQVVEISSRTVVTNSDAAHWAGQLTVLVVRAECIPYTDGAAPPSTAVVLSIGDEKKMSDFHPPNPSPHYNFRVSFNEVSIYQTLKVEVVKRSRASETRLKPHKVLSTNSVDLTESLSRIYAEKRKQILAKRSQRNYENNKEEADEWRDDLQNKKAFEHTIFLPLADSAPDSYIELKLIFKADGDDSKKEVILAKAIQQGVARRGTDRTLTKSPSVLGRISSRNFQLRVYMYLANNLPGVTNTGRCRPGVITPRTPRTPRMLTP